MADNNKSSLQKRFPYIGPPHRKRPKATPEEKARIALSGPSPGFLGKMSKTLLDPGYPHDKYGK